MAESVVSTTIIGIGNLLIQETQFLGAVSGKVEQLKTEMKRIQRFLKDADKTQDESEEVRGWVSEIRELAYEAEDVVATFIAEAALRKEKGLLRRVNIFVKIAHLYKVGVEIDAIIAKIANLRSSLETHGIKINNQGEGSCSHTLHQFRITYAHTDEENTVGLVKDVEILLEKLVGQQKRHQVVSIHGMGGLGKSTLAKKLYNHIDVKGHYNAFAWVFVSQQFQVQQILGEILRQLSSSDQNNMTDNAIAAELYNLQKSKKCLVIIDDLWRKEDWNALKHAFPIGNIQGTIVLTTRTKALGSHVDPTSFDHGASILSDEESWQLFQMKALRGKAHTDTLDPEMIVEGEKMVKSCSGLPLAIVVLGGVLATKSSNEWKSAAKSFGMFLKTEINDSNEYSTINAVLALSYSELPYHLKPCFLSLAQFPEDYSIPTKMLFRLWMAEGIVSNQINDEDTPEAVAERYLLQLVDRCIVHIGEIGSTGRIKTCRLHDLIRDLSLSKAKQENFLEIVNSTTENSNARRVVVVLDNQYASHISLKENRRIRSLTLRSLELQLSMVSGFKMLRVLVLDRCRIPQMSIIEEKSIIEIGKLIHLKYLSIDTNSDQVPSSLGNLRYLQTFIFTSFLGKLKISKKISNLQELRYLHIRWGGGPKIIGEAELNVGNLRNLRTLRTWGPIYIVGLEKLKNLKKLEITFFNVESFSKVLNGLATLYLDMQSYSGARSLSELSEEGVHELLLGCGELQKLHLRGKIEKLPEYHQNFTPNLTKLTLANSGLKEDPMPLLEKLPKLTVLLIDCAFEGQEMVCSSKGFPRLRTLILRNLCELVNWRVDEGSLANLSNLSIEHCLWLDMVPEGIRFINTLAQFETHDMHEQFNNRVKGDDFYKVAHVSSVVLHNSKFLYKKNRLRRGRE